MLPSQWHICGETNQHDRQDQTSVPLASQWVGLLLHRRSSLLLGSKLGRSFRRMGANQAGWAGTQKNAEGHIAQGIDRATAGGPHHSMRGNEPHSHPGSLFYSRIATHLVSFPPRAPLRPQNPGFPIWSGSLNQLLVAAAVRDCPPDMPPLCSQLDKATRMTNDDRYLLSPSLFCPNHCAFLKSMPSSTQVHNLSPDSNALLAHKKQRECRI
jgi:hypothetical protein